MTETKVPVSKSTTKIVVPAVYGAMFNVLEAMSVEKNGTLPGNMGGKSYITAVDASAEAKRQFVENNLIILPVERETHKEVINDNGRKTVIISIEGTYTIVSTVDGSSVVIGGVGDGLAIGTAVAANIASTNALKNALLRTFLVTEQSVEDAGKNGPDQNSGTPANVSSVPTVGSLKNQISKVLGTVDGAEIKAKGDAFFQGREGWANNTDALAKWLTALQSEKAAA